MRWEVWLRRSSPNGLASSRGGARTVHGAGTKAWPPSSSVVVSLQIYYSLILYLESGVFARMARVEGDFL